MLFQWRLVNEDYEGRSDDSSLEVDGEAVVATCNGEGTRYPLVPGDTVFTDFKPEWPVDPTDKTQVDELTRTIFGRRLA